MSAPAWTPQRTPELPAQELPDLTRLFQGQRCDIEALIEKHNAAFFQDLKQWMLDLFSLQPTAGQFAASRGLRPEPALREPVPEKAECPRPPPLDISGGTGANGAFLDTPAAAWGRQCSQGSAASRIQGVRPLNRASSLNWSYGESKSEIISAASIIHRTMESRYVINPESSTNLQKWDIFLMMTLSFVAVVTPLEVSMMDVKLDALFFINRLVDMVFVIDMILQFFLMYPVKTVFGQTHERRHHMIVMHYLRGWFVVDFMSIFPFDALSLMFDLDELSKFKLVKVMRLLRLLKLMRVLKASKVIRRLETGMSFTYQRLALYKFFTALLMMCHWLACMWAMTLMLVDDLQDGEEGERLPQWVDTFDELETNVSEKTRDTPWKLYTASLYFVSYTVTTVGYGDIGPMNIVERVVCIILIVTAGVSWSYVLGQVCGILGSMGKHEQDFRNLMDDLNYMMVDRGLPLSMCRRIRGFFLSTKGAHRQSQQQDLLQLMSPALQGEVAMEINSRWLKNVGFLCDFVEQAEFEVDEEAEAHGIQTGPCHMRSFVVEVAMSLQTERYSQTEKFGKHQTLYIMHRGLALNAAVIGGQVLNAGRVWGEDFVLSCAALQKPVTSIALTHLEVFILARDRFMGIVESSESLELIQRVRKHVVRLAVQRGFIREAKRRLDAMVEADGYVRSHLRALTRRASY